MMMVQYTKRAFRPLVLTALIGAAAFFMPMMNVWAAKGDVAAVVAKQKAPINVTLGKAELIKVPGNVADVLVANSSIVDVQAVQSDRLYIVGLAIGDTNIIVLDEAGEVLERIDVHVTYDLKAINALVSDMFPGETAKVSSLHGQMFLSGKVSTPDKASKISDLVAHYVGEVQGVDHEKADQIVSNLMEVKGEQQVMLQVKVLEASRNFIRDLGINTVANDVDENAAARIFGGFPPTSMRGGDGSVTIGTGAGIALPNDPAATIRVLTDSGILGLGTLGIFVNALEKENLVTVLAEPNLTAISGQQAGFLAGGEFPVPVGRDQIGNLVIEYREFGVSLNFRPVVMSGDRINLQLNTEVSSLDFVNAVGAGDLIVPGLDVRRADTTIEIPSGGSLMIAGLLQSDAVEGLSGLPGIRKAPILGDLISSKSFNRNETELVIMISAYLVEPFADKKRVEKAPKQDDNHLAKAFAANIRRSYDKVDDTLFAYDEKFGYVLK